MGRFPGETSCLSTRLGGPRLVLQPRQQRRDVHPTSTANTSTASNTSKPTPTPSTRRSQPHKLNHGNLNRQRIYSGKETQPSRQFLAGPSYSPIPRIPCLQAPTKPLPRSGSHGRAENRSSLVADAATSVTLPLQAPAHRKQEPRSRRSDRSRGRWFVIAAARRTSAWDFCIGSTVNCDRASSGARFWRRPGASRESYPCQADAAF